MKRKVGGRGHAVCVIMTHCVRKSICDSPLNVVNCIFSYQIMYRIYKSTAKHKSNSKKRKNRSIPRQHEDYLSVNDIEWFKNVHVRIK